MQFFFQTLVNPYRVKLINLPVRPEKRNGSNDKHRITFTANRNSNSGSRT